jgi:biotin carboxylase
VRIIVLDCFSRMGLAVINALDREFELVGGDAEPARGGQPRRDRFLRSPRLQHVFRYPGVGRRAEGFREAILDACRRYRPDAVFPTSSATATALALLKSELGDDAPATFVCERHEKLAALADKWALYEVALELGIPTPKTVLPTEGRLETPDELGLPVVAKPRLAEAAQGIRFLRTLDEVNAFLLSPPAVNGHRAEHPYILQELIEGEIHNVGGCAQDGVYVSLLTNKHLFERFEHGGPGIVHVTTWVPEVMEYARALAARFDWNGPLHFNFMLDDRGRYLLTDCNPRVWGSTELAVAAGVNVCQQAVDVMVLGRRLQPQTDYRVGLVSRWFTPGTVVQCFRKPRTPRKILARVSSLVDPRPPAVTNLRRGNFRHLATMVLDTSGHRHRRRAAPAQSAGGAEEASKSSATSP